MYEKQNFQPGEVLSAAQLDHIEEGLVEIEKNVVETLEEVKKRGSDIKKELAEIVTEKGVETASSDDFDVILDNARQIQTGISNTQVLDDTLVSCIAATQVVDNTCVSCIATTKVTHDAVEE